MSGNPKVIVIGLDGATWDLIIPLVEKGKLPTFEKLLKEGTWGKLESTIPPVTFPAWHSLFTGLNPGKLGVFDFVKLDLKQRKVIINTPSSFHGKPIWKILEEYGYKSVLINIPTAKVSEVNGAIVGGAFSNFNNYFYPPEIEKDIKELSYHPFPVELSSIYLSGKQLSIEDENFRKLIDKTIQSRFQLAERLIKKYNPDFLALVIFVIDNIQHFFWGDVVVEYAWTRIDKYLGEFIEKRKDSYILLCSDHGFTKLEKTFYISKYLEEKGYLHIKRPLRHKLLKPITQDRIINLATSLKLHTILQRFVDPERLQRLLGFFPNKEGRVRLEDVIHWEKSKCIPLDRGIYLNCREDEKKGLKLKLKEELSQIEIQGERIIERVYEREEIYSGKYVKDAPDLILQPRKGVRILESPFVDSIVSTDTGRWKGEHDKYGIFLIKGHHIQPKELKEPVKIYDITPTILKIFGIPTDTYNFDGRPLDFIKPQTQVQNERARLREIIKRKIAEGKL